MTSVAEEEVEEHVARQEAELSELHGREFLESFSGNKGEVTQAEAEEDASSDEEGEWEGRLHPLSESTELPYGSHAHRERSHRLRQLWKASPEDWLERCKHAWRIRLCKPHRLKTTRGERPPLVQLAAPTKPLVKDALRHANSYVKPSAFTTTSIQLPTLLQSV